MRILKNGLVSLALLVLSLPCLGQTASTGALSGTVSDPSGAVVAGAKVTATNESTGETRTTVCAGDGTYRVPLLPPGRYRLEVTSTGFKTVNLPGITVVITEINRLDIQLEVGAMTESVQVQAAEELVQTETSARGRVVDATAIVNLPLVSRNYTQIIGLSPGVTAGVTNASEIGRGSGGLGGTGVGFYAHGDRSYDNNFQMNGLGVNDVFQQGTTSGGVPIPNPDTIQEFKVQTTQYDAAFGRNAGANVNVVTRGGANQFHGTAFEFFRNTVLNANNFFSNVNGQKKPVLNQNQFGGTLGGPIIKQKLLFFGSYQGTRQINGVSSLRTVLGPPLTNDRSPQGIAAVFYGPGSTPADRRGVFQNMLGGAGPAIAPDGSNINPVALKLLQMKLPDGSFLMQTPQTVSASGPLQSRGSSTFSTPSRFNEDQYMLNLDWLYSSKTTFNERFFLASSNQTVAFPAANVPGFPNHSQNYFVSGSIGHSYVFSPTLLNQVRFGFNRIRTTTTQDTPFTFSQIGVTSSSENNDLPNIGIQGSYTLSVAPPGQRVQDSYLLTDDLSWNRGNHSLRFGGGFTRTLRDFTQFRQPGQLIILSFPDFLLGLNGPQSGTGVFSNIFGSVDLTGLFDRKVRLWEASAYAQDDYKVLPQLTLNLGLRYDFLPAITEDLGRFSNVDPTLLNPAPPAAGTLAGIVVAGNFSGTVPAGVTQRSDDTIMNGLGRHAFGPRMGFALQVLPHSSRMVLRGGYGVYFSRITGQVQTQNTTSQPFGLLRISVGPPTNAAATFANPFAAPIPNESSYPRFVPYTPTTALTVNAVDPNVRPGTIEQYSLSLQTQIARNYLWEVGYVGTRGTDLLRMVSLNQAFLASPSNPVRGVTTNTVTNIPLRVPFQGWTASGLQQVQSKGKMRYNGLETSLARRFTNGIQFLVSYTWSKTLDSEGANVDSNSSAVAGVGNQNDDLARYGPANFSRPHRLIVSYVYEFPWFKNASGLKRVVLGNWSISGVTTFQAGHPLTLTGTNANNVFGITTDRAQLAPGCSYSDLEVSGSVVDKLNNYFNSGCINRANLSAPLSTSNPALWPIIGNDGRATDFGNSGVGIIRGPDQRNFDFALIKRTVTGWPTENANIEFRTEFFNAFNTPQFADPDTTVTNGTFGRITATNVGPRLIQFSLKLNF